MPDELPPLSEDKPDAVIICVPASVLYSPPPGATAGEIVKAHCGHPVYLHPVSRITITKHPVTVVVCTPCAHEKGWMDRPLQAPTFQRAVLREQYGVTDEEITRVYRAWGIQEVE